jgi:hypothetical protein
MSFSDTAEFESSLRLSFTTCMMPATKLPKLSVVLESESAGDSALVFDEGAQPGYDDVAFDLK